MAKKNKLYTTPVVCKYANEWFVFFRFWSIEEHKYKTKKISRAAGEDLNRIKDLKEREKMFQALRDAREKWLQLGWNPFKDPEFNNRIAIGVNHEIDNIRDWYIKEAFEHAVKHKKLAKRSKPEYKKSVDYFIKSAEALLLHGTTIQDLTRTKVKAIFANLLQAPFNLSSKNYNKRLCHIKSLLTELEEWKAVEENPAFRIKELKTEQTHKFIPLTGEEKMLVKEYLYLTNYRFYLYVITLYYTGIRPDEVLTIKVKDLDCLNLDIHLNPFSQEMKVDKERSVAMHEKLMPFLSRHIENCNEDYYVFSKDFKPGEVRINERSAAYLWNKHVRVELGINKYMYALKHTGADDLIRAGADEEKVVDHLGHSDKFMTRRYTQLGLEQSRAVIRKTPIEF